MGSRPIRVFATGGLDVFGKKEPVSKRCHVCEIRDKCPYNISSKATTLDYNLKISVEDGCVYSQERDLNDNSMAIIEYNNGARATYTECHFTPEYTREFTFIGDKGKMYGFYSNEGNFTIRIQYRHTDHIDEYHPPLTEGAHGGGDRRLMDDFLACIVNGKTLQYNLQEARDATAVAAAAEESIETGLPVDIRL
jgi:predicted dehydrogenase